MGLVSIEVEVTLNAQSTKRYENLGYAIPRYYSEFSKKYVVKNGTTLLVKVQDLPMKSHVLVDLTCDYCGKKMKWSYGDYNNRNHDGKVYCFHCAHKVLNTGKNSCKWNPNLTYDERKKVRKYPEYIKFVKSVLARDNYTCQCCGKNSTNDLEVHHLYAYSAFPQYRVDQTQAITLCKGCHSTFHSWHIENLGYENRGKCTRDDYEKWIGYALNELLNYNGELSTTRKVYDYDTGVIYDKAEDCAIALNICSNSIYACCNHKEIIKHIKGKDGSIKTSKTSILTAKGHHLFWLDEYNNLTQEEILKYIKPIQKPKSSICKKSLKKKSKQRYRKIVCITTGEIFEKIKDGGEKYGMNNPYNIIENCNRHRKWAGKLSDGTTLIWMYYENFLQLTETEQQKILLKNKGLSDSPFIM